MSDYRFHTSSNVGTHPIDDGTNALRTMPPVGLVGSARTGVATMSLEDRFISVMHRTLPKLPADIQEEFAAMLSPAALAIIAGVLVLWAGSHYVGVGFIVDALMLVGGVIFLGWQIKMAAEDFTTFLKLTYEARTEQELDQAATHLSNFVAVVGVAAFLALLTKGAGKKINVKAASARVVTKLANAADAGMTNKHFQAILKVAMDPDNPRIVLFRKTNSSSVGLIERGFPAKPKEIKVKTDKATGVATCNNAEVQGVRNTVDATTKKKYYTVDANRKTATNGDGHVIELDADWPIEPNQVIDPTTKKPLVGDYDLFDVFDPKVIAGQKPANQGNMVLASKDGKFVDNFANPEVNRTVAELNGAIGSRRVMHGHHGAYDSIDNLEADEVVTAFLPDGTVVAMNKAALKQFYEKIGRSTLDLKRWME